MSRHSQTSNLPDQGTEPTARARLAEKLGRLNAIPATKKLPSYKTKQTRPTPTAPAALPAPAEVIAAPVPASAASVRTATAEPVRGVEARPVARPAQPIVAQPRKPTVATDLPHLKPETARQLQDFAASRVSLKPNHTDVAADPAHLALPMPKLGLSKGRGELWEALAASRKALKAVGIFSLFINLLMLTGPLFMLQVYDRVLTSGSLSTLMALALLTTAAYGVIGMLELVRSRVITRIGTEIEQRIGDRVFESAVLTSSKGQVSTSSALRELETLRTFIAGPAPMTAFDGIWTPLYMLVIFLTHWIIGVTAVLGAAILLACAWATENRAREPLAEAQKSAQMSFEIAEGGQRNSDAIRAMGMLPAYRTRWQAVNRISLGWQMLAADRLGGMGSISKTMRLLLQSIMLAVGAALAVRGDISAGAIIACTIIFGRALAPVEQAVAHWRGAMKARESYQKLEALLKECPPREHRMSLPRPQGHISVAGLRVAAPETRTVILANINFDLKPGSMMAVIGPSASGKSTLARALVGLWPPFAGTISIDGARLEQWNPDELGQHIGYLPQDIELFSGTVRENIARFHTDATDVEIIAAAKAAHAHDLIMAMAKSYDTDIGPFGAFLSGGQKQRVGLARALFRNPPIIVLDEPNANLDRAGDEALAASMDQMRARGQVIILVSHRVQAIGKADILLYLDRGVQKAFGPKADVLRFLNAENAVGQKSQINQVEAKSASAPPTAARG